MRIAVDAMGGDFAPREIVRGAIEAARKVSAVSHLFLVGDEARIRAELTDASLPPNVEIVHASESIGMEEPPALAVRRKRDSSINRAMDMVKKGDADAMVSAGNTGAVVVSATLKLRTLEGVVRPAIATVLPTQDRPLVLIDAGANTDCDPQLLVQFAAMGSVYSEVILGCSEPVVGLVSIGGEESKGNEITKETFKFLDESPLNFRGNVEGHDVFRGETDVAVCDGFVGNIILKTSESVAHAIGHWLKREFKRNPIRLLGAALLGGALRSLKRRMDPELYGGAPLLGVRGVCIITHGASTALAILHAVRVASESVHHNLNQAIIARIAQIEGQDEPV
jgi:glycerol-3-phosphate acyltransferase PlsX